MQDSFRFYTEKKDKQNMTFHIPKWLKSASFFLFFKFVMIGSLFVQGQGIWTLEDCIDHAIDNNLQLKRMELLAKSSKNDYFQSKMEVLPNLDAFAQHSFSSGRTVNLDDYTYVQQKFQDGNLGAQANMNIFNGLQQTNIISRNKFNLLASVADVDKQENDMIIDIVFAYMKILYNKELLGIAEAQLELINQQVVRTSKFVEVGKQPMGELLDMKSQAAAERLNTTTVKNQLRTTYLELVQLLDLDSVGNFRIQTPDTFLLNANAVLVPFWNVYSNAVATFPEIKSAEYGLKAQEKNLAITRGQRSPRISMGGLYYTRYSELGVNPIDPGADYLYVDQMQNNQYRQLSFSLSIPIFERWSVQNDISNAKISVLDAKLSLDLTKQVLYKTIQQTHNDAVAAFEKYKTSLEVVEHRETAFNYSQEKMDVGIENSVDYNIAKNNLMKAQAELLQAKYEFVFTTKILDFYQGIPITF